MKTFTISRDHNITLKELNEIIQSNSTVELSTELMKKVEESRTFLENQMKEREGALYGINTGFGSLCKEKIPKDHLAELQVNLVRSHACGMGKEVPEVISKWVVLLKIISLSKGYSGVSKNLLDSLIEFHNKGVLPVIFEMGSLGASGDLAPLAHLALSLIGEGESWHQGSKGTTSEIVTRLGISKYQLVEKEGLAILNGTQFMQALMAETLVRAWNALNWSCIISALSVDAFQCRYEPFHPAIHRIRNQDGQKDIGRIILELLDESEIGSTEKTQVQDPYSFRCIPQVLGASLDNFRYVQSILEKEINGVTDNPNIIPEENLILSGGNFHGQPLALALDFLAISMSEIGNISERRVFQMLGGKRDLPEFLTSNPGLNSGLMIPQYAAASLVSMNKQLCSPSSVDSITSSNGQEDHVSMGANAGLKAMKVVENLEEILAIELVTAAQAYSFRTKQTSPFLKTILEEYRKIVPPLDRDRNLHEDLKKTVLYIQETTKDIGL